MIDTTWSALGLAPQQCSRCGGGAFAEHAQQPHDTVRVCSTFTDDAGSTSGEAFCAGCRAAFGVSISRASLMRILPDTFVRATLADFPGFVPVCAVCPAPRPPLNEMTVLMQRLAPDLIMRDTRWPPDTAITVAVGWPDAVARCRVWARCQSCAAERFVGTIHADAVHAFRAARRLPALAGA